MSWFKQSTLLALTLTLTVAACDEESEESGSPCLTLCEAQLEEGCGELQEEMSCALECEQREAQVSVVGCLGAANELIRCLLDNELVCTPMGEACQGAMSSFEGCLEENLGTSP